MELHSEELELEEPAKQVIRDYFSGKLQTHAQSYATVTEDIENELRVLEIYDWLEERLKNKKLDIFILSNRWYFDDICLMHSSILATYDLSCTVYHPQIDIILLDANARQSFPKKKRMSLHEILHEYIFHNHRYLAESEREEPNSIAAFNKKIERSEEISHLNEYVATVIPYLFPSIEPAYGNAEPEPRTKALLDNLKDAGEGPSKLLKLATCVKTVEELERGLGIF